MEYEILKVPSGQHDLHIPGVINMMPNQIFVKNHISPHKLNKSLLVKQSTGSGKTIASLMAGREFIDIYQKEFALTGTSPYVYIVGFSKNVFIRELMNKKDFGIVTQDDLNERAYLRRAMLSGLPRDREIYRDFEINLKRKISRRETGGFYKFLGYKELFNRLFTGDTKDVLAGLVSGDTKVNEDFVKTFMNSLVICDEIHFTYNSQDINNYGFALQVLYNIYDIAEGMDMKFLPYYKTIEGIATRLRGSCIRRIHLSATVINASADEVIDLINITIPGTWVKKEDFFTYESGYPVLLPGAEERIKELFRGYVSLMRDYDPYRYPEMKFIGELLDASNMMQYAYPGWKGKAAPYLYFVRCPMTPFHYKAYMAHEGEVGMDEYTIYDTAFPSGTFKSSDLEITRGEMEEVAKNIRKYSGKYTHWLEVCSEITPGKDLTIHNNIRYSGVLLLAQVLANNGWIEWGTQPNAATICHSCRKMQKNCKCNKFIPLTYAMVHGEMQPSEVNRILEAFRDISNARGEVIQHLIGSRMINQSTDFNCVTRLHLIGSPSVTTIIQQIGRAVRNGSNLAIENKPVEIRIYISIVPRDNSRDNEPSREEIKYFKKIMNFIPVQKIDTIINSVAVDYKINKDRIAIDPFFLPKFTNSEELPKTIPGLYEIYFSSLEREYCVQAIKQILKREIMLSMDFLRKKVGEIHASIDMNKVSEETFQWSLHHLGATVIMYNKTKYITLPKKMVIPWRFSPRIGTSKKEIPLLGQNEWVLSGTPGYPRINIYNALSNSKISFTTIYDGFVEEFSGSSLQDFIKSLEKYDIKFHVTLLEKMIDGSLKDTRFMEYYIKLYLVIYESTLAANSPDIYKENFSNRSNIGKLSAEEIYIQHIIKLSKSSTVSDKIVGHFLEQVPKIWSPIQGKWIYIPEMERGGSGRKENDIIVGYLEKFPNTLDVKFKLRSPIHKIKKNTDIRIIERGSVCSTKKKEEIIAITKSLDLPPVPKIRDLCENIKLELLSRELQSIKSGGPRWFYLHFEKQPN